MGNSQQVDRSYFARLGVLKWPWADIVTRILLWLILGIAINVLPVIIEFVTGAGDRAAGGSNSLVAVLSSGDLLIATTAILPSALADVAINVRRARRIRIVLVTFGGLVSLASLLFYCFTFANYLSFESHRPMVATNLSPSLVAKLSVWFFLGAIVIGSICAGFLAAGDKEDSDGE